MLSSQNIIIKSRNRSMSLRLVNFTVGVIIVCIGIAELIPALVEYFARSENAPAFINSAILSVFLGGALIFANRFQHRSISIREAFLLTTLSWFLMSVFAALPLYMSSLNLRFVDAFFEALSGVTTTGSTVLSDLDNMSPGILLWRSMTQWIGGIGIIAFAIAFLPFLRIGGMQLFRTESSDQYEKVMPRSRAVILSLVKIYIAITILCAILYRLFGMNWFDAINHALTTVPTGGYSTHDASFGYFESSALKIIATLFMIIGGVPFILYVRWVFRGKFTFFRDDQVRAFLAMLVVFIPFIAIWLWLNSEYQLGESLLLSAFNIVSVITTTGYATADYTAWGPFSITFFFFLTYLGGCAGSTSGGLKVMRIVIVSKAVARQLNQLIYPHGVFSIKYQGGAVDSSLVITVLGFLATYVIANVALSLALGWAGLDYSTAISAAATAIANVGPGIGDIIGPSGNFSTLPDTAKWLICAGMFVGRLEILTVMILFTRDYWR